MAFSTEASVRASGTTRRVGGDTASYWAPTLMDPQHNPVPIADVKTYYQVDDAPARNTIAPPPGLRMFAATGRHQFTI